MGISERMLTDPCNLGVAQVRSRRSGVSYLLSFSF